MEEIKVTFETAKLAKEKGFIQSVYNQKLLGFTPAHPKYINEEISGLVSAPTQSLLQKWLREVHNIHLLLEPYYNKEKLLVYSFDLIIERTEEETIMENGFKSYENALEVGLQEGLKLISNEL